MSPDAAATSAPAMAEVLLGDPVLLAIVLLSAIGWALLLERLAAPHASTTRDRDRRRLRMVATIAAVLPLLGLLGTVLGMMDTFAGIATPHGFAGAPGGGPTGQIAGGIERALLTTQAGLTFALPLIVAQRLLASRLDRAAHRDVPAPPIGEGGAHE